MHIIKNALVRIYYFFILLSISLARMELAEKILILQEHVDKYIPYTL